MIGVLGATGYTGRLVVDELVRRGLPARVGGRDRLRLDPVLRRHPGADLEPGVVDVTDGAALGDFLVGLDAVISCVGPYVHHGLGVVDAAVSFGVPYVDCSGEPDFVTEALDRHRDAPLALVPACGFDGLIGDLTTAVAARQVSGTIERVLITYRVTGGGASRGSLRTTLEMSPPPRWWRPVRAALPDGSRWAMPVPFVDRALVARRLPEAEVVAAVALPTGAASTVGIVLQPLLRPVAGRLLDRAPEGPSPESRAGSRFTVTAEVTGGSGTVAAHCEGADPYGLTARLLVEAATRLGDTEPGTHTPATAFDAPSFLHAVADDDLRWWTSDGPAGQTL